MQDDIHPDSVLIIENSCNSAGRRPRLTVLIHLMGFADSRGRVTAGVNAESGIQFCKINFKRKLNHDFITSDIR